MAWGHKENQLWRLEKDFNKDSKKKIKIGEMTSTINVPKPGTKD